jgi:hypothetical protein
LKLLTWNACRLLAPGRELALVNILTSSGADIATITECEIPEGSGEFSGSGYTRFLPTPSLQGGKTRVLILVKNELAVRANVKVIADIMDPAVQSVWLHFSHHRIGSATLGAFIWGESTGSGLPCLVVKSPDCVWDISYSRLASPRNMVPVLSSTGTSMLTWTG